VYHPYLAQWGKYWDVGLYSDYLYPTSFEEDLTERCDSTEIYYLRLPCCIARRVHQGAARSLETTTTIHYGQCKSTASTSTSYTHRMAAADAGLSCSLSFSSSTTSTAA
jgi:hypothetical protein